MNTTIMCNQQCWGISCSSETVVYSILHVKYSKHRPFICISLSNRMDPQSRGNYSSDLEKGILFLYKKKQQTVTNLLQHPRVVYTKLHHNQLQNWMAILQELLKKIPPPPCIYKSYNAVVGKMPPSHLNKRHDFMYIEVKNKFSNSIYIFLRNGKFNYIFCM